MNKYLKTIGMLIGLALILYLLCAFFEGTFYVPDMNKVTKGFAIAIFMTLLVPICMIGVEV